MKKLLVLILALAAVSTACAGVAVEVREADGVTPFDGNEIMVGTKLTLVVSSDCNDYWSGGLFLAREDRALANLTGRGFDPNTRDWTGSHYEEAGEFAKATAWQDSYIWGFDLYTFYPIDGNSLDNSTVAGDWFVIDYEAIAVGECNVGFYDYSVSWDDPNYYVTLSNVPTRDLNSDEAVNFTDFAIFASQYNATNCNEPNWCYGADLDMDSVVDYNDLSLFVPYWLWPHPHGEPGQEPNYPEDPNITYSIVDANGNNEITMDFGTSITLYVDLETNEPNYVSSFDFEVNISDTNLGSIDNRHPADPNGSTARILVDPDNSIIKSWGPGTNQEEGIRFYYLTLGSPISDGYLASFVFTCEGEGDVTLELINWNSSNPAGEQVYPTCQSTLIHQVDPNSQQMMSTGMDEMITMEETEQPQAAGDTGGAEIVEFLEQVWPQLPEGGVQDGISEAEVNQFIDSMKKLYEQANKAP